MYLHIGINKNGENRLKIGKEPTAFDLERESEISFSDEIVNVSDVLSIYLRDIGKVKLLTADEEIELAKRISLARDAKDDKEIRIGKEARERFILSNLRLVVSIAKKYAHLNVPLMDLIQEGTMGLMKAVDRYEVDKGFKFSTYATWWIRQSISRSIANHSRTIRIPVHVQDKISKVRKMIREYVSEHGREPDIHTISMATEIPVEVLKLILYCDGFVGSLDIPIGEGESNLGDITPDTTNLNPEEANKKMIEEEFVNELLQMLSDREQTVIRMRFGIDSKDKTFEEIGNALGITRERVRQIELKAIKKLKKQMMILNAKQ